MRRNLISALIALAICAFDGLQVIAQDGDTLIANMRLTGKPALIIAGNESCVYCRQMAKELAENAAIQPLVQQFFVVKVDTDSADWPVLQRAFQFDKDGIPAVFVVRGDGKLLYSESGKPRDMQAFLQNRLESAGTILDERKLDTLQKAARDAQAAFKRRKFAQAVQIVNDNNGSGSFAAAAVALSELADQLQSQAIAAANKAEARITNNKQPAQAAIELVQLRRDFTDHQAARAHIESVWSKLADSDSHKGLMQQAEKLEEAARLQKDKQWQDALAIYQEVVAAGTDSPAGKFAEDQIAMVERRLAAKTGKPGAAAPTADEPQAEADGDATAADKSSTDATSGDVKKAASCLKMAKLFHKKDPAKARDYLEKAIAAAPESDEAEEAQKLLDALE
ncbi:MAG: thioredoxin family protein [Planctomycetaceae bacterium]